ncbi:MAG: alpha/beta fold hydrolase, partial [bacterium]
MRFFIPLSIFFGALTGFMTCTSDGQSTSEGTGQIAQIETEHQEPDRITALEQEIHRLQEKTRFDNARLRKEVDDLRMELLCREQVKFSKVSYQSTDNLSIPAYLFEPLKAGKYPAILWVHGGQHGTLSSRSLPRIIEWVQSGYVIFAPDYRGSSGYSEAFYHKADYGGKEIDDLVAAVDFLETLPPVIKKQIGVIGASHGGYNSLMAIIRYPDRFK